MSLEGRGMLLARPPDWWFVLQAPLLLRWVSGPVLSNIELGLLVRHLLLLLLFVITLVVLAALPPPPTRRPWHAASQRPSCHLSLVELQCLIIVCHYPVSVATTTRGRPPCPPFRAAHRPMIAPQQQTCIPGLGLCYKTVALWFITSVMLSCSRPFQAISRASPGGGNASCSVRAGQRLGKLYMYTVSVHN